MLTAATPSTLLLGVWIASNWAAITGAVRDDAGNIQPDALTLCGATWEALAGALDAAELIATRHIVILTNCPRLLAALSPPFAPPPPDRYERVFYGRTEWVDVGVGGVPHHWRVLTALGGRWGGRWAVMGVADIPKARELWQCSQSSGQMQA